VFDFPEQASARAAAPNATMRWATPRPKMDPWFMVSCLVTLSLIDLVAVVALSA
jgi:hypothetical protein